MRYTKIPADTFRKLQMNAAILLSDFKPSDGSFDAQDQIGATSGGINFTATPTDSDLGEDIDNCPKNIQYYCLKLKDVLQRGIMRGKHPPIVSQCCFSFTLCADVVR